MYIVTYIKKHIGQRTMQFRDLGSALAYIRVCLEVADKVKLRREPCGHAQYRVSPYSRVKKCLGCGINKKDNCLV